MGDVYAKVLRADHNRAAARDGIESSLDYEKKRDQGNEFRQSRQRRLSNSSLRSLLLLHNIRNCISSSNPWSARTHSLQHRLLGRCFSLRDWTISSPP